MSFFLDTANQTHRWPSRVGICINHSAHDVAAKDVSVTVPADHELFWRSSAAGGVQSDGKDIRVTTANGTTLVTALELTSFTYASRTLTMELDNASAGGSHDGEVLWLYWGNASATTVATTFVSASPLTGYILAGRPAPDRELTWRAEQFGVTAAADRIQKTANETILVAIRYRHMLAHRRMPYAGSLYEEEPSTLTYGCYDGGSADGAMVDLTAIRLDNDFIYVLLKAGSSGSTYTVRVVMVTTGSNTGLARTVEYAFTLAVQTPTE